ncbi:MAG: ABC transporter permease [Candidatus Aenigmarchaeota archaeon]|nr:ABC transporter permease [Candidatus Aenigmarchaeota archaeon]
MKLNDIIKLSMNSLSHRGLRSWLTILGIVIGVAAVVSIISIGSGTRQAISSQLGGLGANIITVSPGFERAFGGGFGGPEGGRSQTAVTNPQNLTTKDAQIIKSVSGVQFVDGIISERLDVTYLGQTASLSVQGVDPLTWREMTTSQLDSGRFLTPSDGNVIVIGYNIANNVFKKPLVLNTQISIEGKMFSVVGILQQSGGGFGGGGGGGDNTIIMPINTARTIITNLAINQFSSIQVKVADAGLVNEVINSTEEKLLLSRHVTTSTKDFTITSAQQIQGTISNVMGTLTLFLTGIAAISLLVGAIGIANTMFMSVMERTRQIGTLKALGATNFEIMKLFVFESAMIGFMGGLIGIFLGFIAAGTVSELGVRLIGVGGRGGLGENLSVITPQLVLFSIGFSVFIGAVSGLIPARRAASLQPVEALRYE